MLYGVDVDEWVWRPDVRLLVGLIERLPYEPRSMYRARSLGDDAWFGWTTEAALLAEMVDMQAFAAAAAAVNKKARHKRIVARPEVQKQTRVVTTRDDVGAALDALLG